MKSGKYIQKLTVPISVNGKQTCLCSAESLEEFMEDVVEGKFHCVALNTKESLAPSESEIEREVIL